MPFRNLIEKTKEQEIWEQIKNSISARDWPGLVFLLWMSRVLFITGFIVFCVTFCAVIYSQLRVGFIDLNGIITAAVLGVLLVVLYVVIAAIIASPWRIYILPEFKSIRDLIPYAITSDRVRWDRETVSIHVKRIVVEQLGLSESDYTEDSRFVEDFGMW